MGGKCALLSGALLQEGGGGDFLKMGLIGKERSGGPDAGEFRGDCGEREKGNGKREVMRFRGYGDKGVLVSSKWPHA